jgi:hypothetical protein
MCNYPEQSCEIGKEISVSADNKVDISDLLTDTDTFAIKVPTLADELHAIAEKVKKMTLAERQAERIFEQARELSKEGRTEIREKVMTKEFFRVNKEMLAMPEDKSLDEVVDEFYDSQKECYDLVRKQGFTVEYKELDLPSTFDLSMDPHTRHIVEQTKRFTEAEAVIKW